jgi:hypothetical protein
MFVGLDHAIRRLRPGSKFTFASTSTDEVVVFESWSCPRNQTAPTQEEINTQLARDQEANEMALRQLAKSASGEVPR